MATHSNCRLGRGLLTTSLMLVAGNASGQQTASLQLPDLDRIEELVVTAQKRTQSLQDVTASVLPLSENLINQNGIKNVYDLGFFTPSLVVSTNGTTGRLYIRGVGNNLDFLGSQGAVAMHVDGVYQSRQWGVLYDLLDVNRVEVLRGPQGTIYGRNATGGAVNVISNQTTEDLTANLTLSAGNFNAKSVTGTLSSALTENTSGRLAFARKVRNGFTDNQFPDADRLDDQDSFATRGELHVSLRDNLDVRVLGRYFERDVEGQAIVPTVDGLASSLGARSNAGPFKVQHNRNTFFEAQGHEVTAITTWDINASLALQSISAYHKNQVDYVIDTDGTEIDAVAFLNGEQHEQLSQELRLYSVDDAAALTWQLGLYYLHENTSDEGIVFLPAFGFDIPVAGAIDGDAYALFAQGTYDFSDHLSLTLGLRYSAEKKTMTSAAFGNDHQRWDDWTFHASLEYRLTNAALVYGSASKGFKSGGYNVLAGGEKVDPEYVWSWELGAKTQWLNDKLLLNGAAFYSQYDDQQVNTFTGAGLARVDNAAKSNIYGAELDLAAVPMTDMRIGLAISYLNAKFDEYLAPDPFLGAVDLAGSRLSHAPRMSATLYGDYRFKLRNQSSITAHVGYAWQDDVKYDVFDSRATNQPAYAIANAAVSYLNPSESLKVGFFVRNLTDKVYFTTHIRLNFSPDGTVSVTGEPRTFGLEISLSH